MDSSMRFDTCSSRLGRAWRVTRAAGVWSFLLFPILTALTACDDDLFKVDWEENPDTAFLYSLARPELNLLSGFDFISRIPVRIESPNATGQWDMVLDTHDGELVLLPPGAIGIVGSKARIIPMGDTDFDAVRRAPSDTTMYIGDEPVPVVVGHVYVVRTRQQAGFYGRTCVYYGKFEPLEKDPVAGTMVFQFDASPVCNSRKLYPEK
jgi:hypothetical protein